MIRVLTNVPQNEHLSTKFQTRREFWILTKILFLLLRFDRLISWKIMMGLWNAVGFSGFGGWEAVQCFNPDHGTGLQCEHDKDTHHA